MNEQLKKFINKYIWLGIILFSIRCCISRKSLFNSFSLYDLFGYAGEAIGVATFLIALYERLLWKYDYFNDMSVLYKKYSGTFISSYDNIERQAQLEIKQTLLTVNIIFITQESRSKAIYASIDNLYGEKNTNLFIFKYT